MKECSIISNNVLKDIANAIREKRGSVEEMTVQQMYRKIEELEDYSKLGSLVITGTANILEKIFPNPNDPKIEYVYLPRCTAVYLGALEGFTVLRGIDLPECRTIKEYAFRGCSNLREAKLPKCTNIESGAFENTDLYEVILPACVKIGNDAFKNSYIHDIDAPSCVTVEGQAFLGCGNLYEAKLNGCTEIDDNAFKDCSGIQYVSLVSYFVSGSESTARSLCSRWGIIRTGCKVQFKNMLITI